MTDRDELVAELQELSSWTLAETIVDLEDGIKTFMSLDDTRLKQIKTLEGELEYQKKQNKALAVGFMKMKLDPDRLDSALRMYVAELDYDIHKMIECPEDGRPDQYPEEVNFFLRCWETAGES